MRLFLGCISVYVSVRFCLGKYYLACVNIYYVKHSLRYGTEREYMCFVRDRFISKVLDMLVYLCPCISILRHDVRGLILWSCSISISPSDVMMSFFCISPFLAINISWSFSLLPR